MTYLERFGLTHRPLPRDACGPTFDDHGDDFGRSRSVRVKVAKEE